MGMDDVAGAFFKLADTCADAFRVFGGTGSNRIVTQRGAAPPCAARFVVIKRLIPAPGAVPVDRLSAVRTAAAIHQLRPTGARPV